MAAIGNNGRKAATSRQATPGNGLAGEIGQRLRGHRSECVQAIYTRVEAVSDEPANAAYQAGVRSSIAAMFDHSLEVIEHGLPRATLLPSEAAIQVRRAARIGVSPSSVLRGYVAGHAELGELVAEQAKRIGVTDAAELHDLRRTLDVMLEHLLAAVESEYNQQNARQPDQRRAEIVERLLADEAVDIAELDELDMIFTPSGISA